VPCLTSDGNEFSSRLQEYEVEIIAHGVHQNLARIYWIQGKGADALSEEREEANLAKDPAKLRDVEQVAGIFAKEGLHAALLQSARINEKVCIQNVAQSLPSCDEFAVARQYGVLGETEKLLFWLKRGLASRVGDRNAMLAISLKTAPEFDCVRSDPRFGSLLRSIGLPE
jgi:hypothetical protein